MVSDPYDIATFRSRLQARRQALGLTQAALAEQLGVPQAWISRLETRVKGFVRSDTLVRLCLALRVRSDYLLGLEDNPDRPLQET